MKSYLGLAHVTDSSTNLRTSRLLIRDLSAGRGEHYSNEGCHKKIGFYGFIVLFIYGMFQGTYTATLQSGPDRGPDTCEL